MPRTESAELESDGREGRHSGEKSESFLLINANISPLLEGGHHPCVLFFSFLLLA